MKSISSSGVPEVERETEVESEEDLEVETGDAQGVEAEADDPDPLVLAIKARKLRIGNVIIGLCLSCRLGTDCLPYSLHLKKKNL